MIFANHAHIFPGQLRPEGTVDRLLEFLDECGIDKAVTFPTFPDRFADAGIDEDTNVWLSKQIKGQDRLVGFGVIDFEKDDLKGQVERIADLGFKGLKMHPPYQEFVIDGPEAFEVYEKCEELGLFISFHSGMHWHRLRDNNVLLFDEVAWNFPKLKFSLEHIGGYHFFKDALAVMCNNSRNKEGGVYAGWTSVGNRKGKGDEWALTDDELEIVIAQTGEDRSIFGLDFPYSKPEHIKDDIARIKRLDISEECKEKILGKTLEKALFGE
ncbi:MAG: amidohydrolase family protein [Clostridia bacterium]|nr:amidohydrolase family protein [Clostridia bacterium]